MRAAERQARCPKERRRGRRQRLPQLAPGDPQQTIRLPPAAGAQHGGQRGCGQHRVRPRALLRQARSEHAWEQSARQRRIEHPCKQHRLDQCTRVPHPKRAPALRPPSPRSLEGSVRAPRAHAPPPPRPAPACVAALRPSPPQTACGSQSAGSGAGCGNLGRVGCCRGCVRTIHPPTLLPHMHPPSGTSLTCRWNSSPSHSACASARALQGPVASLAGSTTWRICWAGTGGVRAQGDGRPANGWCCAGAPTSCSTQATCCCTSRRQHLPAPASAGLPPGASCGRRPAAPAATPRPPAPAALAQAWGVGEG